MAQGLAQVASGGPSPTTPTPPPRHGSPRSGGLDDLRRDVTFAMRSLLRQPGFATVAILTLGLGIGANTAIFSVVNSVLLTPLPFGEPDAIVRIFGAKPDRGWDRTSFTHANFWGFRDMTTAFEDLGAFTGLTVNLTGFDYPEQLDGARISAGFFRILRVEPVLGRTFRPGEDQEGVARTASRCCPTACGARASGPIPASSARGWRSTAWTSRWSASSREVSPGWTPPTSSCVDSPISTATNRSS